MIKQFAPGKLFIAGEWAVLEPGNPAVLTAVDKGVFAEVSESKKFIIEIEEFGLTVETKFKQGKLDISDKRARFLKVAIETVFEYLQEVKPVKINTTSKGTFINGTKVGFGSSAATVVSCMKALLEHFNKSVSKMKLFKL